MILHVTRQKPEFQYTVEIEDAPRDAYMLEQTSLYGAEVEYRIITSPGTNHRKTTWLKFIDGAYFDYLFDAGMESNRMLEPFRIWFNKEVERLDREMRENATTVQAAVYGQPRVSGTVSRKRRI